MRVVDEEGQQLGVMSLQDAIQKAQDKGLDLIQVTEKVDPPVCKFGEYGKYLYIQEKKDRGTKKQIAGEQKEIRLTYAIGPHDMDTRLKQAIKFLEKGYTVRVTLPLRGRQKAHGEFASEKINHFLDLIQEKTQAKVDRNIKQEPRGLSTIVSKK